MSNNAIQSAFGKLPTLAVLLVGLAVSLQPSVTNAQAQVMAQEQANLILLARQMEQNGSLAEAERTYERVLATDLTRQEAHHRLGVLAAQRGDLDRAIQHFTTAEGLGEVTVQLLNDFGGTLYLKGDLSAAEEKLRKTLVIDPANRNALNNLSLVNATQRKRAQPQSAAIVRRIAEVPTQKSVKVSPRVTITRKTFLNPAQRIAKSAPKAALPKKSYRTPDKRYERKVPKTSLTEKPVQQAGRVATQTGPSKDFYSSFALQPAKVAPKPTSKKSTQNTKPARPSKPVVRLYKGPLFALKRDKSPKPASQATLTIPSKAKQVVSRPLPKTENSVSLLRPSSIKMVSGSRTGSGDTAQKMSGSAQRNWQAQTLLAQGDTSGALQAIEAALRTQPKSARYLLTKARCLTDQAEFSQAAKIARSVETSPVAAPVEKAQALVILGQLTLESGSQDAAQAIAKYMQAISLTEPLTKDSNVALRRAAQHVQLNANLGVAHSIGRGKWNKKSSAVPVWIGRADQLAKTMIEREGSPLSLRLRVVEGSMRAHSSFEPAISPHHHLSKAEALASDILSKSNHAADKLQTEWQLGLIYAHAIKLACVRKEFDQANQYAQHAQRYLEKSAGNRSSSDRARNELGTAYCWMGIASASSAKDQEKSLDWYIRSSSLLVTRGKKEAFYPSDTGSALIKMGNAFSQAKLTQKSLETTESGTHLLEQVVDHTSSERLLLTQAYKRLADLHHQMGHIQQAKAFNEKSTVLR